MKENRINVTNYLTSEIKELVETCEKNGADYKLKKNENGEWFFTISPVVPVTVCNSTGCHKEVVKLDKNFHIYIHGDRSKIQEGMDDKGKYVKLYYKEAL